MHARGKGTDATMVRGFCLATFMELRRLGGGSAVSAAAGTVAAAAAVMGLTARKG